MAHELENVWKSFRQWRLESSRNFNKKTLLKKNYFKVYSKSKKKKLNRKIENTSSKTEKKY